MIKEELEARLSRRRFMCRYSPPRHQRQHCFGRRLVLSRIHNTGRRDSTESYYSEAMAEIPSPYNNSTQTLDFFARRGFDAKERNHCSSWDFARTIVKMSNLDVLTGAQGFSVSASTLSIVSFSCCECDISLYFCLGAHCREDSTSTSVIHDLDLSTHKYSWSGKARECSFKNTFSTEAKFIPNP
ncbi:unnamed protein product [Linum tenue]|uniref:Uncharacterized protein n=1 Tax=Linum tenue TaxID=586396 RepID=A0AAV0RCZ5_9ROSI|nr:unnamed protein product [Linum tenue]